MSGKNRAFLNRAGGGMLCFSLLASGMFLPSPASAIEGRCVSGWCPVHGQVSCDHTHYSAPVIDYEAIRRAEEERRRQEELRRIENQKRQLRGDINSIKDNSYSVAAQRRSQIESLESEIYKLKAALEAQRKKLEGKVPSGRLSLGIYGRSSRFSAMRAPVMPLSGGLEDLSVAELEDYKKEVQGYLDDLESYYGTGLGELRGWLAADKQKLVELEHLEASLKLRKSAHSAESAGFKQIQTVGKGEAEVGLKKISSSESDLASREKKLQEKISKMGDPVLPFSRPSPPGPGATRQEREEYKRKMDEYLTAKKAYEKELAEAGKEMREIEKLKKGEPVEKEAPAADAQARKRELARELADMKAPSPPVILNPNDPSSRKKIQEYRAQQAAYDQKVKGLQEELKGLDDKTLQAQKAGHRKAAGLPDQPLGPGPVGVYGETPPVGAASPGRASSSSQGPSQAGGSGGKLNLPDAQTLFDKAGISSGQSQGARGPLDKVRNLEGLKEEAGEGFTVSPSQETDLNIRGVPKALPKVLPGAPKIEPPSMGDGSPVLP